MAELGLDNRQAELLIPEVARLNKIGDIRKLKVGQVLLLPFRKQPLNKEQSRTQHQVKRKGTTPRQHAAKEEVERGTVSQLAQATSVAQPPQPMIALPTPERTPPSTHDTTALPVRIKAISVTNPEEMVDTLLKALDIEARKRWVVEVANESGDSVSIKVDRYFEEMGKQVVINCSPKDQFNYTLLALLERQGYKVIQAERDDFRKIAATLLQELHKPYDYVTRKVGTEGSGREAAGYLVGDGATGRQIFLTTAGGLK